MAYSVSAPNLARPQFLGIEPLINPTGYASALGFYNILMAWQISHLLIAIVADTPSVNWGTWEGAVYYLASWVDRQLLYIQCVHHTEELVPKAVSSVASQRPSTAPADALFKRFYDAITDSQEGQGLWDKIQDKDMVYNTFDQYRQTPLGDIVQWVMSWAREAREAGDFPRDTYKDNVNLIPVFGGEMLLPGFRIPRPPPVEKSRFLSTSTNYLILELCKSIPEVRELYTEQECEEIRVMTIFSAFF